ncbi:sigma-70 family RNA polymerase sigma factor (plasmid) [Alicyclobacillus sp. TC]|uniref:RNA polymerase sigma factor (Sigma-70 family) n=1 Tax=Alicyclobacillus tolerans TaxID=90970 RepID=A0ABT9M069_9BACL|nr:MULTISPECIES: sigma-70 family RNA polymerase sigma factor [Alicyclobacillus]MDP9729930.1 RNA polymerase sigma factor (sigma-70 family) [Alicyclobacillus tengchongensis]QRF24939.1 sigma-70 family RNA polymerase sigma factor [Alicyclobacillus sp. TC]
MTTYTPEQEVAWIRKIIRHALLNEQRRYRRWDREKLVLNSPTGEEESLETIDTLGDESAIHFMVDLEWDMYLQTLSPKEQFIIRGLYWKNHTQSEVAQKLGISQSRVSQIHQVALQKLREMLERDL